jgi:hypothetical protein
LGATASCSRSATPTTFSSRSIGGRRRVPPLCQRVLTMAALKEVGAVPALCHGRPSKYWDCGSGSSGTLGAIPVAVTLLQPAPVEEVLAGNREHQAHEKARST